jgi:PAS domain S-box-containing protein
VLIIGTHSPPLVALSVLIAAIASFTALDLAGRFRATTGRTAHRWLATAAIALGGGIWAMHFVAMLAFSMPGMAVHYDARLTALSFVLPILVTGVGFDIVKRRENSLAAMSASGLVMGLGIAAMHYTGMAAMQMGAHLSYSPLWVALSVLLAIGASKVALWLAFKNTGLTQKIVAAVVMGIAIAGMHYTAMVGANFTTHQSPDEAFAYASIDHTSLAVGVGAAAFLILSLALIAAMFDRRFAVLAEKESVALRQSEAQFRNLYRKTPLPLYALDYEGRIEQVSDAWLKLLEHNREAVVGRPLTDFMTQASSRQRAEVQWPRLIEHGEISDIDHQFVTSTDKVVDVLLSESVERDNEGRFRRVLGGLADVTARRLAEDALRQAQKIETVGQLTGGVAHDFNNLLAVIIGNLDLVLKRTTADPKVTRLVENALQGAQRGAALTQRMLAFARRQDLRPEAVDVPALVRGMEDLLQRSLGPQMRIETRFPLGALRARADANQLEMALLNLVVNARDAMPEGGTISIGLRQSGGNCDIQDLPAGEYICLSVSDTGEGMDEATLTRAREPFFTTKGVGKGTGLGISMVHGFAQQSGGKLVLKSRKGDGTTAEIWLPVAAPLVNASDAPEVATVAAPNMRALHLLVVDDDALVRMNTVMMLEDLGHSVTEASSGQEALAALEADRFDLLITDQAMPKMTGVQLAAAVREINSELPILVATGYAELPPNVTLPRLSKPFDQSALSRAIDDCLKRNPLDRDQDGI